MTAGPGSPPKIELLCFGNAIVDIFAKVDRTFLETAGIIEPVQHIPRDDARRILEALGVREDAPSGSGGITISSGGGAANAAKIAAMLNINTAFCGSTGSDALGAVFEKELRQAGVTPFLTQGAEKTGTCFVFESGGETSIAASPGAALEFGADDVTEELTAAAGVIVLDGFILDRRPLVQRILRLANRHGIPVALDAASVFQIKNKTEEILHYCRNYPLIVFMNADEAVAFYNTITKKNGEDTAASEREKEALILREICPVLKYITEGEIFPVLVIKLGRRGAVVLAGGNIYRKKTVAVKSRDSTGAGDAFCAAFLAAWIRGKSITKCAALGNKVARKILSVPGTHIKAEKLKPFAKMLGKR